MKQASLLHFVHCALALVVVAANAVGNTHSQRTGVTPVQKVVELLEAMLVKGKEEKHKEQIQYAAYKRFCDSTIAEENKDILQANAEKWGEELATYDKVILKWTGVKKKAARIRKTEKATYEKTHKDYSESIDAINRAIFVLKVQSKSLPQSDTSDIPSKTYSEIFPHRLRDRTTFDTASETASETVFDTALKTPSAFLQLRGSAFAGTKIDPVEARSKIEAFLEESAQQQQQDFQQGAESSVEAAPEATAYAFQSDGVIEWLKKLLVKFSREMDTLDKEEVSAQQTYDLLLQDLSANIELATKDKEDKVSTKADKTQAAAKGEGNLRDGKAADVKNLKELTATCKKKSDEFKARLETRADELEAIQKALDIISGEAVAKVPLLEIAHASRHSQATTTALAAVRSERNSAGQAEVAAYLHGTARALDSHVLEAVANYASSVDEFGKVKRMIKDILAELIEEESSEAKKTGWCDTELAKSAQTRKEKSEAVEMLSAEIERLEASVVKGAEDLAELSKSILLLDATIIRATRLRLMEEIENKKTIEDAQAVQIAIARATQLLKDFYAKAGAFRTEEPAMSGGSYSGMKGESDSVLRMLETIRSDFSSLETSTKAAEASANKEYKDFVSSSNRDKASKRNDEAHKTKRMQFEKRTLTNKKEELELSEKELDAAFAYFDKLKPDCIDSGVSCNDHVAKRSKEIEFLQEALKILNGDDIP